MESRVEPHEVVLKPKAPPAALLQAATVAKRALPGDEGQITLFEDRIVVRDTTTDESLPRRYTLAPSERAADTVLSIGPEFDQELLNQPRMTRDAVRAELTDGDEPRLRVTVVVESAGPMGRGVEQRRKAFAKEMAVALAVIRYGDRFFFERHPELDRAPVLVESGSTELEAGTEEEYGRITDYRVTRIVGESRRVMVGAAALAALGIGALVMGKMRKG